MHTYTYKHKYAHTHIYTHAQTHNTHTQSDACTHTDAHTDMRTHTHTHIHTYFCITCLGATWQKLEIFCFTDSSSGVTLRHAIYTHTQFILMSIHHNHDNTVYVIHAEQLIKNKKCSSIFHNLFRYFSSKITIQYQQCLVSLLCIHVIFLMS